MIKIKEEMAKKSVFKKTNRFENSNYTWNNCISFLVSYGVSKDIYNKLNKEKADAFIKALDLKLVDNYNNIKEIEF